MDGPTAEVFVGTRERVPHDPDHVRNYTSNHLHSSALLEWIYFGLHGIKCVPALKGTNS